MDAPFASPSPTSPPQRIASLVARIGLPRRLARAGAAVLLTALCLAPVLRAQPVTWEPLPGPEGPVLRTLGAGPGGLLVAAEKHHAYEYDPDAGRWTQLFRYVVTEAQTLYDVAVGPDGTRWIGADGVYELPPGAPFPTWHPVRSGQHSSHHPNARHLAVSPAGTVLFGAFGFNFWDGGYRSTDGGQTWPAMSIQPTAFAFADGTVWAGTEQGVYRSTNEGASWAPRNAGIASEEIAAVAVTPAGVVLAASAAGVWRSTDEGASWALASAFTDALALLADAGERVWAGTASGLYRSDDGGATWTGPLAGLPGPHVQALARDDAGTLYAATGSTPPFYLSEGTTGVYRSDDGGATWTPHQRGLPVQGLVAGFDAGAGLYAASSSDGVFHSADGGASWTEMNEGLPTHHVLDLVPAASGDLYLIAGPSAASPGGVFHAEHGTGPWLDRSAGLPDTEFVGLGVGADDHLFVLVGSFGATLYVSDDGGQTWTAPTVPGQGDFEVVSAHPSGTVFALRDVIGSFDPAAVVSTDNGATWTQAGSVPLDARPYVLTVDDQGRLYAGNASTLVRSDDGGQTWAELGPLGGGFGDWVLTLHLDDTGLYAGTMGGVFRSGDDGETWEAVNAGLPEIYTDQVGPVSVLFRSGEDLLLGTPEFGMFTSGTPNPVSAEPDGTPQGFALLAPYPNPLRARTTLRYTLPEAAPVRLAVYDAIGREVAVLVEASQPAGAHSAVLDAGGLPSGVYLVRLEAGARTETRRVLLVR